MSTYRLSARTLSELDLIADYTLLNWGSAQADRYMSDIFDRFQWLAQNPMLGRSRDEIRPGVRSFRQGSHMILYEIIGSDIYVLGIPHASADFLDHFDD